MPENNATTMPGSRGRLLAYAEARTALERHPVRSHDVPIEFTVSLAVPSTRWGAPAYAVFAGASGRRPGEPRRLSVPDRWWALDARSGQLVVFARTTVLPFSDADLGGPVELTPTGRTAREQLGAIAALSELMDHAVPDFFAAVAPDPTFATDLRHHWEAVVPAATAAWYRALAPDFFHWLDDGGTTR
jgi:hypothetical protein